VAVKFIRMDLIKPREPSQLLKRFEREGIALARMDHPNIVRVLGYGEYVPPGGSAQATPYLVMTYVSGGTLKDQIGKPLPYRGAIDRLLPVAQALQYAHAQGIIHRDVKPANILLTEEGTLMLSDFGIAKTLEGEETPTQLTGTGVGIGTPEYMAPEQAGGKQVDHRTDIYSLGIILYEMITGHRPFTADTPLAVVIKQINDPLKRPSDYVKDLPESVEQVIFKALAKQPENRFQTMDAMIAALEKVVAGESDLGFKVDLRAASGKRRGSPLLLWGGIALVAVVMGLAAVLSGILPVNGTPTPTTAPTATQLPTDDLSATPLPPTPEPSLTTFHTPNAPVLLLTPIPKQRSLRARRDIRHLLQRTIGAEGAIPLTAVLLGVFF
jgi:serine/threonine protein kinase